MSGYENFERKPKHECCREGYPLNLISLESIICKGSNCSPVELLGLKREHVLGEEKALTFICLEMSEKQSCAKPSLHLQQLWGSWWREGPLEAFLDVYYFKTTARRSGFATWRCLAVTLQMVFIRKMRDTIFAKHFNSRYRTVLLSQKQCLLLITMKPRGFSHICHHQQDCQEQPWNMAQNISKAEADCEHHCSELDLGKPAIWTLLTVQRAQSSQGANSWEKLRLSLLEENYWHRFVLMQRPCFVSWILSGLQIYV